MADAKIGWGILGAGRIAGRFAESLSHDPRTTLVAASCRTQEKADAFAAQYGAERGYAGHDALLADPTIDAIYLSLPHGMHHEWAIRALRAGKAVLCEKPAALTQEEVTDIARVAQEEGLLFMEGMKARLTPAVHTLMAEGGLDAIGDVTRVEASLCNDMVSTGFLDGYHGYLVDPTQGGVLWDCGIYCASWLEALLPGEPRLSSVQTRMRDGIDFYVRAELDFDGRTGVLECAMDEAKPRQARIIGTRGSVLVDELHRSQRIVISVDGKEPLEIEKPYVVDDFFGEVEHFNNLLEEGKTQSYVVPLEASSRMAHILDVIRAGF